MAWYPAPFDVTAEIAWVQGADLSGDGRDELILATREPDGERPDRVGLTLLRFDARGVLQERTRVSLGNRAAFFEAEAGLWGVDSEGLVRWDLGGQRTRVVATSTPLGGLGPATPRRAEVAEDLDGDGRVELLLWSGGRWCVYAQTGGAPRCVDAPAQGDLSASDSQGGESWRSATRSPALVLADVDGDGTTDLLQPSGRTLKVAYGPTWDTRSTQLTLPLDLDPPEAKGGEAREEVADVLWRDVDGDGRVDLLVHLFKSSGSFFDGRSELRLYRGNGAGFDAARTVTPGGAVTQLELHDLDEDGDLDLVMLRADIGFSNIARSLVAREVAVDLLVVRSQGTTLPAPAVLRTLTLGLEDFRLPYALKGDLDGDGLLDLVVEEDGALRLYLGTPTGLAPAPAGAWTPPHRVEELTVVDTDGDGLDEVVAWSPGLKRVTLLRWK